MGGNQSQCLTIDNSFDGYLSTNLTVLDELKAQGYVTFLEEKENALMSLALSA